ARQKSASPPARRISSTTALAARGSRPTISTLAPSAAKTRAIPLPRPRLEPVITAVLLLNLPAISNPSVTDGSLLNLESRQRSSKPLYWPAERAHDGSMHGVRPGLKVPALQIRYQGCGLAPRLQQRKPTAVHSISSYDSTGVEQQPQSPKRILKCF